MVYIDNGYDPCIGDVVYFDPVWLGRHVVTDTMRLKKWSYFNKSRTYREF